MNREAVGTVVIALCCLFAIGTGATTMDSAVETDPDEVVNTDTLSLPIGTQTAIELKEDLEGDPDRDDPEDAAEDDPSGDVDPDEPADDADEPPDESADSQDDRHDGAIGDELPADGGEPEEGAGAPPDAETDRGDGTGDAADSFGFATSGIPGWLWQLLRSLVALLLSILPALLVALVVGLTLRHRERLLALIGLDPTVAKERGPAVERASTGIPTPENDVARAWVEMLGLLGLVDDHARTPGEYARDAVAAGADPEAVAQLRTCFEEVRYGDAPVTEVRVRRATRGLERVEAAVGRRAPATDRGAPAADRREPATDGGANA